MDKSSQNSDKEPFFFQADTAKTSYYLNAEESGHIAKVLRLNTGDRIRITNGRGMVQLGTLTVVSSQKCRVEVIESLQQAKKKYAIHIAIAPTKQISRIEWFVEKATEIGVDRLSFIQCKRSERRSVNPKRLEKKTIGALKQSQQTWLPILNPMMHFNDLITSYPSGFIAHPETSALTLKEAVRVGKEYLVLIGPEGGFTTEEIEAAQKNGFQSISLGNNRLRTETAGIAACCALNIINQ